MLTRMLITEVEGVEMLSSYPIKINNVAIPFPDRWSETPKKISNEFETESGGRQLIVVRNKRLEVSASFTVSSRWLKRFEAWRDANYVTVSVYDAGSNAYVSYNMDIVSESFRYELIRHSERMKNTNGLYKLSFELEEL